MQVLNLDGSLCNSAHTHTHTHTHTVSRRVFPARQWASLVRHGSATAAVNLALTVRLNSGFACTHAAPHARCSPQAVDGHPSPQSGLNSTGEIRLVPDPGSLRDCSGWAPGHSIACVDMRLTSGKLQA